MTQRTLTPTEREYGKTLRQRREIATLARLLEQVECVRAKSWYGPAHAACAEWLIGRGVRVPAASPRRGPA